MNLLHIGTLVPPFQGGYTGSNPVGGTSKCLQIAVFLAGSTKAVLAIMARYTGWNGVD